ncbi:MAG: hypothetical protein QM699_03445 [Amaricoccus sp.]|uniref:hypothetical protein n=1 Tax=Amaricoccus sp. TaxID=1872485 RepID=UPI0039E7136A
MTRMILTDRQWALMEPHCLGKATDPGRTGGDARLFMEAVLWIARKRLDLVRDAARAHDAVPGLIVANWVEPGS